MVQCTYLSVVLLMALFMNVRAFQYDQGSGSDDETIDSPTTREPVVTTSSHNIMSSSILVSIAPSSSLFGQPLSSVPLLVSSPAQSSSSLSRSLLAHNNLVSSVSVLSSASSSSPLAPSPTPIPGTASTSPNGGVTTPSDTTASPEGTDSPTNAFNPTSPPGESQESIASISIFLILMLLGVSVMLVHFFIKIKFHYLPESIAFVIIGCVVGALFWGTQRLGGKDLQYWENFSPQSFFLVLLPPIIFESGYSLHKGNFFQNLGSIMMFAVVGTTISAAIVGGGLYGLGVMGVAYPLDIYQSFTFGSLISAVDPVATLAIFHALNVDPTLNMLVFGESVLNDAVSIVLTKTILQQLPSEASSSAANTSAAEILGNSAGQFCIMFFGSALLGTVFALISALFLKVINLKKHHSLEFTMWVIFAFGPYFLAEGLHLSGIMAVLFCGIVMSHYTHFNLSPVTQVTVQQALRTVSFMAETVVFLYLGMALFSINKSFNLGLIVWSLVLILIARAANIFPLSAMMNCCRSVKINMRMQCVMWFSGLRGAVAFALAENLDEYFPKEVTGYLVTTTLLIVLFTIIILGGSTMPLLKFLKADKGSTLSKTEDQGTAVNSAPAQQFAQVLPPRNYRSISNWFMYLDYKYVKPFLIRRFTRQEVTAARHEMQRQTAEWYRGVREAPLSDKEEDIEDTDHSASSALLQNL